MNVQIPNDVYKLFEDLYSEYGKEHALFNEDPIKYIKNSDFIIGGTLGPSSKGEFEEIKRRKDLEIPTVQQFHKSKQTICITRTISDILIRSNQLCCLREEGHDLVDYIAFKYLNELLSITNFRDEAEQKKLLQETISNKIINFKAEFEKYEFKFPVFVMGLDKNVELYQNISLINESNLSLDDKSVEKYMHTRTFKPNYNINILSDVKASYKYSTDRAMRAKEATINILQALHGSTFGNAESEGPFVKDSDRQPHYMTFFLAGIRGRELTDSRSYHFNYNKKSSEKFWDLFENSLSSEAKLHNLLFSVPDKILNNADFDKSLGALIERSLRWLADAINEQNNETKIVKLTVAIESLINFKSDSKRSDIDSDRFKDTFIRRTIAINTYQDNVESKAIELYNARSSIAHGSPLKKGISFDAVLFTATTVILAIQLFSTFKSKGIDEIGFDKALPQYIEEFGQLSIQKP